MYKILSHVNIVLWLRYTFAANDPPGLSVRFSFLFVGCFSSIASRRKCYFFLLQCGLWSVSILFRSVRDIVKYNKILDFFSLDVHNFLNLHRLHSSLVYYMLWNRYGSLAEGICLSFLYLFVVSFLLCLTVVFLQPKYAIFLWRCS